MSRWLYLLSPKKLEQYPREVSPLGEGLSLFMVPGYLREFTRDRPNWPLTDLPHLDLSHPVLDWREKGEGRRENTNQKAGLEGGKNKMPGLPTD